ncbi:BrnA antitoxin family protein [Methylobacterium sp. NEAU 140]|uniref:BrnA antitoxin family protein n=1 Tax=Methylobacterium sp. NEAU 140 TaxID=3064945 RepID=UPI00273718F5|nr:BrnA antitoxin family protein [Methylobacterium sp. NEAU 140]MDP4022511.1 BrnA antitoxin family protein [Methylobacterium sp. NEAU 140]
MESEKRIVSYSAAELKAMIERGESETDWDAVRAMTDAEVEAAVASDPDEAGMEIDWSKAVFHPETRKTPMTIRLDPDVLAFFRNQGRGYQTKINAVLRAYMEHARK